MNKKIFNIVTVCAVAASIISCSKPNSYRQKQDKDSTRNSHSTSVYPWWLFHSNGGTGISNITSGKDVSSSNVSAKSSITRGGFGRSFFGGFGS